MPELYLVEQNAGYGKMMLSTPELTAMDLICYENRIGGLNRAAEIILEMNLDFRKPGDDFWRMYKAPIIQRLGFILERVLGLDESGAYVYLQSQAAGVRFRKTLLDPLSKPSGGEFREDSKWKIIVNCELEIEI